MKAALILLSIFTGLSTQASPKMNSIYGEDNRQDSYEFHGNKLSKLFDGSVLLANGDDFSTTTSLRTYTLQESEKVCSEVRFSQQPTSGFCSGALVGTQTVLTAGHCVRNQDECDDTHLIFDFVMKSPSQVKTSFPKDDHYRCRKLLYSGRGNGHDIALLELDRPVRGHTPLSLEKDYEPELRSPLALLGYPSGLPAKLAMGGSVREIHHGHIVTDLDAFSGNSGSPVFNMKTGGVIGVLSSGDKDYEKDEDRGCKVPKLCTYETCEGEDVTLLDDLSRRFYLDSLL
jgi:V8-like Glu-specific endopeptidase